MSIPLSFIPEIVSVAAAIASFFTLFRARDAVRNYSDSIRELEKVESLQKFSNELAELCVKAEDNPNDDVFVSDDYIVAFLSEMENVLDLENSRLDRAYEAATNIDDLLADYSPKRAARVKFKVKEQSAQMGELLARRRVLAGKIKEDLSRLKTALAIH